MASLHGGTVDHLARLLTAAIEPSAIVRQQLPVRLGPDSEPLPDILIAKARSDFYTDSHPTAADTLLVVEISSTTLRFDRHVKVPMYARHGIPEVWVLDVNTGQLHYYRSPENGSYLTSDTVPLGRISIEALATTVDLSALAARRGSGSNTD